MDSALSVKNASGKTFSLLNENTGSTLIAPFKVNKLTSSLTPPVSPKRKYHCMEPGCNKSFTTSGHLARHNRIHTGEKNFHCLHPGCPSRFSRQDNMMQHYRTHLSQKARRPNVRTKRNEPELYNHSYHVREHKIYFQPLVTRPKRSTTMPSLPHPFMEQKPMNRPKRALSASNDRPILPPLQQKPNSQQPLTSILHLSNIVSSFG